MKKDEKLFRYNPDELSKVVMEIVNTAETTIQQAYQDAQIKKAVAIFEAGYHQALKDYNVPHPCSEHPTKV